MKSVTAPSDLTPEGHREFVVRELGLLERPHDDRFDRIIRLVQRLLDVPVVMVNVMTAHEQRVLASVGCPLDEFALKDSFCAPTVASGVTTIIDDLSANELFSDHPWVTGTEGTRFYAGLPLSTTDGTVVGTFCALDTRPRTLSERDREILADLARWAEDELVRAGDVIEAKQVQRRLLAQHPLSAYGWDLSGASRPRRQVSGDYYDWQEIDGAIQIVLADVMGKGMTAAIVAAGLRALLRSTSRFNSFGEAFRRASIGVSEDLDRAATLVTMFAAQVQARSGDVEWIDAGHGLAAVFTPGADTWQWLRSNDLPLGVTGDETYDVRQAHIEPESTLVVFSDGVLDYFDDDPEAVATCIQQLCDRGNGPHVIVRELISASRGQEVSDDVSVVALKRWPAMG